MQDQPDNHCESGGQDNAICAMPAWYLVYTKPRQERAAQLNLEHQGYICYLPQLNIEKIRRRKAVMVTEPMFARYLFIRLDCNRSGQSWSPIRSTPGVSHLVGFGGQPAKVDDRLIEILRHREHAYGVETLFESGDRVTVADGPFAGVEAIYQTADAQQRSMILLKILHNPVPMRVETARLRRIMV